jgi:hypothetical protein
MTQADLYQQRPSTAPLETIALINQMQPTTALVAGQKLKWVSGGPPTKEGVATR